MSKITKQNVQIYVSCCFPMIEKLEDCLRIGPYAWFRQWTFIIIFVDCAGSSIHCSAALDLGAGVEQPFDCLRTVRLCSPWGRWVRHWRTTRSMVYSSAPHSLAAEEAIPHLCKQERKRPTRVRRRLSGPTLFFGRSFRGGGCRCWGWKCGVS